KQPRRTFAGEPQAEAFIADPDLLAAISERQSVAIVAISERQSMVIVKQPRRTFAGERQAEAFIAAGSKPAPSRARLLLFCAPNCLQVIETAGNEKPPEGGNG